MKRTRTAWLLVALAVGVPALALLVPLPKGTRLMGIVLNLGHVGLGGFVCILLWMALGLRGRLGGMGRGAAAWLGAMGLLTGIEAFQAFSKTRSPTLDDLVGNGLGATAALVFLVSAPRPLLRRLALAAVPVAIALVPTGLQVLDTVRQQAAFPVLCDFDSRLEIFRWHFRSASGEFTDVGGRSALRIEFQPGEAWPAAMFAYVASDWGGFRQLVFDARTDAGHPVLLTIADATYDGSYTDRYTKKLALTPQWQTLRIPLTDIADGPHHRKIDLSRIHSLQWFADHPKERFSIWLDAIRLE